MEKNFSKQFIISERSSGLIDQGLFSGATLIQTFSYAKILPPEEFGIFALVQGSCLLAQGIQRSAIILPMVMTSQKDVADVAWARFDLLLRIGVAVALTLLALSSDALGLQPYFRIAFTLSAMTATATLAYEFQRRTLYLQRQPLSIILCAITYFLFAGAGVLVVKFWLPTAATASMGLCCAAMIAAIVGWSRRKSSKGPSVKVRDHLGMVGWNLISFLPFSIYNNGMPIIIGIVSDARAVALFTASRLFTAPIQTLLQAIDSVDKPRARRMFASEGLSGLFRSISNTRRSLLLIGLPYIVTIVVGASYIAPFIYADRYPGIVLAVQAWAVVSFLMLLSQPFETGLLVLHKSNMFFWTRSAAAIATLATLLGIGIVAPQFAIIAPISALIIGWGTSGLLAGLLLKTQFRKMADS